MNTTESTPNRPRRLERSRGDRVIAGVCGGAARYFGVDVTLVRVVTVALLAFGGFGVFLYLAAWLLVPEEGTERPLLGHDDRGRGVQIVAIVAFAVLAVAAVGIWADFGFLFGGWPLLLLVTAGALVWFVTERGDTSAPFTPAAGGAAAGGAAAGGATAPERPAPAPTPTTAVVPAPGANLSATVAHEAGTAAYSARDADDPTLVAEPSSAPYSPPPPDPPPPPRRRRRGSWRVTALATGAVCLLVAAVGGLEAGDVIDVGWGGMIAVTVMSVGVALVASAFFGGARGLIPVGILLAALLGGAAAAGVTLNGGVGEREYRVTDGDLLRGDYDLGIGHLQLDLRGIQLARGVTHVDTDLDVGMLEIVAPGARIVEDDTTVGDDARREEGGIDVRRTIVVGSGGRRLELDAHVGVGVIVLSSRPGGDRRDFSDSAPAGRAPAVPAVPAAPAAPAASASDSRGPACLGLAFAPAQSACEGDRDAA